MTDTKEEEEDFDFMANGSMKELFLKMDDIDKEIEEIQEVSAGKSPQKTEAPSDDQELPLPKSFDTEDEDDEDEDEDTDLGLASLQSEMKEIDQVDPQGTLLSGTALKPTQQSPVGIAMKTRKGITKIVKVNPNGLLGHTDLKAGLQLLEINGITIKNAKHAQFLIQYYPDSLTFVARTMKS